jgi:formylglycine-generating enzyme required for sulfatase activity
LVSWPAESGIDSWQVWHGASNDPEAATQWGADFTGTGILSATITGLSNGASYHVWLKAKAEGEPVVFGAGTAETPEAVKSVEEGFRYVPGGTITGSDAYAFTITVPNDPAYNNPGSSSQQKGVFVEGRTVSIASFAMAKYETTQELWYDVQVWALASGYQFQNKKNAPTGTDKNKPVTGISWRDAVVWCNAYSQMAGKDPVYTYGGEVIKDSRNANAAACDGAVMNKNKDGFRLPTEAEREFAARGGDPGKADWMYMYAGSNTADEVAWHHGNSAYTTKDVGSKKTPNCLGIHDLSGNVQEWGWDWMNYAVNVTVETPGDGMAYSGTPPLANQKPLNGGGVGSNITYSCVAHRWGYSPNYTDSYVGFRVVYKP